MGETVIEKIIRNNVGHTVKPGDIVTVNVDRVMIHDIFIPFVAEKFEEMGFKKLWDPDKVVLIYDHLVPASQLDDTRHFHVGDAFAEKYGMKNVHRSDGICHQLVMSNRVILSLVQTVIQLLTDASVHFLPVSDIQRWQAFLEQEPCGSKFRRRSRL